MSQIKTAYSYIRFSSIKQELGDSLRRQMQAAQDAARAKGWLLSEQSYQDLGVSGYKAGAKRDGLQMLVDAVQSGAISAGSVIIIEQMDRLSRQGIDATQDLVKTILRADVEIYSASDGLHLTRNSLNDLVAIIRLAAVADAAHQESAKKSVRLLETKGAKRSRIQQGSKEGMACPFWLTFDADKKAYELNDNAALVRQMIAMRQKLKGCSAISKYCNTVCKSPRGGQWTPQTIKRILADHAIYGGKSVMMPVENGSRTYRILDVVADYYPDLISYSEYTDLQRVAQQTTTGSHGNETRYTNILRGLSYCSTCGRLHNGQYRKVRGIEYVYLYCKGVTESSCTAAMYYRIDKIVLAIIKHVHGLTQSDIQSEQSSQAAIEVQRLRSEYELSQSIVERILDMIPNIGIAVEQLSARLDIAVKKSKSLEQQLADATELLDASLKFDPAIYNNYTDVPDLYDYAGREKLNADLKRIINRIEIDSDAEEISILIKYKTERRHRIVLDKRYNLIFTFMRDKDAKCGSMTI